ncbi:MAG: YkgJ family cysteine cluster protein [Promethearchaeota archaeon]|nr:MAG: YkgJ family cysteine cluster protein [Candidatus Lokiarchaeota archaeon]
MDKAKLDHLVEVIKKREGFECQKCGRCCCEYRHDMQILKEDYEELVKFGYDVSHIKINFNSSEDPMFYEINENGIYNLYWGAVIRFNGGVCPYFVKETNLCSLHPHEPLICRLYPCCVERVYPFSEGRKTDERDTKMKTYEIYMKPCLREREEKGIEKWEPKFVGHYVEDSEDQE